LYFCGAVFSIAGHTGRQFKKGMSLWSRLFSGICFVYKPYGITSQQGIDHVKDALILHHRDRLFSILPPAASSKRLWIPGVPASSQGRFNLNYSHSHSSPSSYNLVASNDDLIKRSSLSIGHGGTLDPLAEGVLPLGLGGGTKLLSLLLKESKKIYLATMTFGTATDTLDATGKIIQTDNDAFKSVTLEAIQRAACRFMPPNQYDQMPPLFSSLKVNGVRAHRLARQSTATDGKSSAPPFGLSPRPMSLYRFDLLPHVYCHESAFQGLSMDYLRKAPINGQDEPSFAVKALTDTFSVSQNPPSVSFIIECSSGFYVRSFIRDLAESLGTVAHLSFLMRLAHGPFSLQFDPPAYNALKAAEQSPAFLRFSDLSQFDVVQKALEEGRDLVRLYSQRPGKV
jgi:tRNA pseudouridine55 synthase